MNYPDSVRFLYSLGNEIKAVKFGLEAITAVARALGNPERAFRSVHVAGTNGKGSTCAMIESGLRAAGVRTGLYTSPHLADPTERIQIAGEPVSPEQFARAFDQAHGAAEELLRDGLLERHPTYFETVTAMGFVLFRELGVETAVIEVGMGGRLDATNIVTPELAVITRVDFDHEAFLGRTLEAIAFEKAGIIKGRIPVLIAPQRKEAERTLIERAAAVGAPVRRSEDWRAEDCSLDARGSRFVARREGEPDIDVACPLAGEHQIENALTAVAALRMLGVPPEAIERGLARTRWPGRLELAASNPDVILDGAHNPSGARALARYIERFYSGRRICVIYGAMRDKSVEEISGILFPLADVLILTAPRQDRAARPETLRELSGRGDARIAEDIGEALRLAPQSGAIFVTGSLFLVAEARAALRGSGA
jgi:dihydrofolate synthase/folylpolyglutamate synthase